ncbi:Mitogen-activated protein kinase 15 [Schistosoma japonicum]|nr:Mitogen-activated protein kinase 15 [Schistosoma japonicum]
MNAEIEPHILKMFEIKKRIGKGAYGIVWKALNRKTKEIIALKKIFDAFRNQTDAQRTFREIAFLQHFGDHPNIVRLYNVIRASSDKDIYLVFEFMETDLHNVIKKGNILNNVHKQYIMYQLLKATAYLHSGEVIHRDQKPSNVLLDSYCLVKLCDFGLARSLKGRSKYQNGNKINCKTLLPALTEYVATRWYRAPEILLACHDYTKGVDIWSLGCILGEMLIGTPLFPGTSTLDQIERIMGGLPKPSSEDLASVKSPYSSSILQKARIRKRRSLDQLLANEDKTAIDLLYKMLHFNPHKRITALEALKHPYVRRFYCPNEIMIMNHHVTPPLDDNVQLTVSEYRDRLYQMISSKKTNTPIKSMVQNGVTNKNDTLKEKNNIVTTIPKPISYSSCSSHTKKQSTIRTVKNHETSEDKTPEQHLHYEKQKLMNQQKQSENNKNDNKTNSSQNHVVCVQVNLLHQESQNSSTNDHHQQHQQQHKVTISKPKLTHTPSTSITGTNKIITTMTPISLANSNNVGIHTNGNTTTSNNHLVLIMKMSLIMFMIIMTKKMIM